MVLPCQELFLLCLLISSDGFLLHSGGTRSAFNLFRQHQRQTEKSGGDIPNSNSPTVGICTIKGFNPARPQKENQDAYFHFESVEYRCFGVLDGHGTKGHIVTKYLADQLPRRIGQQLGLVTPNYRKKQDPQDEEKLKDMSERISKLARHDGAGEPPPPTDDHARLLSCLMQDVFHLAHYDAMEQTGIPTGRSGTTCVVCLVTDNLLVTAHVGDSRAILVDEFSNVLQLTEETTTKNLPAERDRINRCQGRIDGSGNVWYGPVGIAMTRALGDAVLINAGVIPTPIVTTVPLEDGKRYTLVLETDGISNVVSNKKVKDILLYEESSSCVNYQNCAEEIGLTAKQSWMADLPLADEVTIDDITCVVASI